MVKIGSDIIAIVRNVTGRNDANDPMFTDLIMLGYVNDFLSLELPQDVRLYQSKTWFEFAIDQNSADPFPISLQLQNPPLTTIGPPAYIDGFDLFWYQDPGEFFAKWPETQNYVRQRPVDVLYYDNELVFRAPPDQTYNVKIQAYRTEVRLVGTGDDGDNPEFDYLWRYIAYGTALDIFSDFGEIEQYQKYYPIFMRYRSLVYSRTNQQLMSQRTLPQF